MQRSCDVTGTKSGISWMAMAVGAMVSTSEGHLHLPAGQAQASPQPQTCSSIWAHAGGKVSEGERHNVRESCRTWISVRSSPTRLEAAKEPHVSSNQLGERHWVQNDYSKQSCRIALQTIASGRVSLNWRR